MWPNYPWLFALFSSTIYIKGDIMYMIAILIIICGLVILFALEIRQSEVSEEIVKLKNNASRMDEEIIKLKAQIKMKKDVCEENKSSSLLYPPGHSTI